MPLTVRTNGTGASNLITAAWWNDYYNLLTGAMVDQAVTVKNNVALQQIGASPSVAPAAAVVAGTGLSVGAYAYFYTYVSAGGGESASPDITFVTTTSGNQKVNLSSITTGPTGTAKRKVYRSTVGTFTYKLLTTINDNTTTTYTDTTADGSLGAVYQGIDTFGATLQLQDNTGTTQATFSLSGDGQELDILVSGNYSVQTTTGDMTFNTASSSASIALFVASNAVFGVTSSSVQCFQPLYFYNGSTGVIEVTSSFGVKQMGGTKLFEVKSSGNAIISGTQYQTSAGSVSTASGQTFDAFDLAEIYMCDSNYPHGTIVCPGGDKGILTRCTHDACYAAMIISSSPAFCAGSYGEDGDDPNIRPVALCGRVKCKTAHDVAARALVCSDGRGGVRPMVKGDAALALGFALEPASDGAVGIFIRPMFVRL